MAEPNTRLVVTGGPRIDKQHDRWLKAKRRAQKTVGRVNRGLRRTLARLRSRGVR